VTKHRANTNIVVRNNIRSVIIRIAPPRVAFTADKGGELFLLDAEEFPSLHFWDSMKAQATADEEALVKAEKYKAEQWAKRAPLREAAAAHSMNAESQELILEGWSSIKGELLRHGIDPDQPLLSQGVSFKDTGNRRMYVKAGKILFVAQRSGLEWVLVK
jgi:hypothetical protein